MIKQTDNEVIHKSRPVSPSSHSPGGKKATFFTPIDGYDLLIMKQHTAIAKRHGLLTRAAVICLIFYYVNYNM